MMTRIPLLLAIAAVCAALGSLSTQAQERRPGGREGGPMRLPNPIFTALDTNNDGVIDEKEMASASVALKKLDKNGDGKITEDEVRPVMTRPNSNADQMVTRLMEFDKNGDGKLSKEELPERMQALMERGDSDKDGFLTKEEIRKMTEANQPRPGGREGREGGEGRERREGGDRPSKPPAPEK